MDDFIFIENEQIKLGIDTSMGGAITYLALKNDNINLNNDGEEHTYRLNLEGVPNWDKLTLSSV